MTKEIIHLLEQDRSAYTGRFPVESMSHKTERDISQEDRAEILQEIADAAPDDWLCQKYTMVFTGKTSKELLKIRATPEHTIKFMKKHHGYFYEKQSTIDFIERELVRKEKEKESKDEKLKQSAIGWSNGERPRDTPNRPGAKGCEFLFSNKQKKQK